MFSGPFLFLPTQVYLKQKADRSLYYEEDEHERKLALRKLARAKATATQSGADVFVNPMFVKEQEEQVAELEDAVAPYLPAGSESFLLGVVIGAVFLGYL